MRRPGAGPMHMGRPMSNVVEIGEQMLMLTYISLQLHMPWKVHLIMRQQPTAVGRTVGNVHVMSSYRTCTPLELAQLQPWFTSIASTTSAAVLTRAYMEHENRIMIICFRTVTAF